MPARSAASCCVNEGVVNQISRVSSSSQISCNVGSFSFFAAFFFADFLIIDFASRYLSPHGAAFGLEPVLTQSAWFRPHNRSEELDNLFLVGAGTHPGAGLPGVLSSARVLDAVVPGIEEFG